MDRVSPLHNLLILYMLPTDESWAQQFTHIAAPFRHSAANAGDYEACKILLKAGADAMALTDAGTSALHYLVRHSTDEVELFTEVLTLLLNKGADIDSQNKHGESPLIQASFRGKKQSVDFLLEHHAEVNVTTKYAPPSENRSDV